MQTKRHFSNRVFFYLACLVLSGFFFLYIGVHAHAAPKKNLAVMLDIKGGIGPATQDFIRRGMKKAVKRGAKIIILKIDTPGGLSKSMRGIIKGILNSPVPVISYVAPSGARAASAGTYILYASHIAAMAPGTNLGAATPVSIGTPGSSQPDKKAKDKKKKDEKTQDAKKAKAINDARAYIRGLAQLRKRNVKWAELAVTKAASLSAREAAKLNVINYVAYDVPQLLSRANGRVVDVQGRQVTIHSNNIKVVQIHPGWKHKFLSVITDPSVAYILLMIGFYGIFFEFVNPGFVAPGVIGAICLLVSLYAFQMLPINYAGLGLILLGIGFIVAEAFLPSFGILGIGGIISFIMGSVMLIETDFIGYGLPLTLVISVALVTSAFFLLIISMAIRSRKRPVVSGQEGLVGKTAVIEKDGDTLWVWLQGERWRCQSDDELDSGDEVMVKRLNGLTLIVEKKGES